MSTYRIRTHNPFIINSVRLVVFLPVLVFLFYLLNKNDVTSHSGLPLIRFRYTGLWMVVILLLAIDYGCYFIISSINKVTISAHGVTGNWVSKYPYLKKVKKTIKWADMKGYERKNRWSKTKAEEFLIKTRQGEEYRFFCSGNLFVNYYKKYDPFFDDFASGYDDHLNNPPDKKP